MLIGTMNKGAASTGLSPGKKAFLVFMGTLPLLIGGAWVAEDWAGKRYLAKTEAELLAAGWAFDPHKDLPGSRAGGREFLCDSFA